MQRTKNSSKLERLNICATKISTNLNDISILVRRFLGLSHYGLKHGGEMTSKEFEDFCFESKAFLFRNIREFEIYRMMHKYPLGPCVIGFGRNKVRYDDTLLFP